MLPAVRIQRKRTKGWKMPPNTCYVGRGSKWGNPFIVGSPNFFWTAKNKEDAVRRYKKYFGFVCRHNNITKQKIQAELRGKALACWCKLTDPCHADVLLEIANREN